MNLRHQTHRHWRPIGLGVILAAALWAAPQAIALAQPAPVVTTRDAPGLGTILTDSTGMTLYTFKPDTAGVSTCYDQCAATWPPALVQGELTAPAGLTGMLGVAPRQDGSQQLTYNGMPLYRYAADLESDDTYGQGVGNVWFVVSRAAPASSDTSGSPAPDPAAGTSDSAATAPPAPAQSVQSAASTPTPAPMRGY